MSARITGYLPGEEEREADANTLCNPPPRAVSLAELQRPLADSPEELLRNRYLCRGGGLLLAGPTGIGKSSLSMQFMISWALGRSVFGIEPARPIKSLLIQAENDDGDLAEMRDGIVKGLELTTEERQEAFSQIFVVQENSRAGAAFFSDTVRPLLEQHRPDVIFIDPALAYLEGDSNSTADVGEFLRRQLNPLLAQFQCASVVVHHTRKPSGKAESAGMLFGEGAYLGAGSIEWANWARAVLALRATASPGVFELHAGKRGGRLRWVAEDGETRVFSKFIAQAKGDGEIYWRPATAEEAEGAFTKGKKLGTSEDGKVLSMIPPMESVSKATLIERCAVQGIGRDKAYKILARLLERKEIEERKVRRDGKKPEVHLARVHAPPPLAGADNAALPALSTPPSVPKAVAEAIQAHPSPIEPDIPDLPEAVRNIRNIPTDAGTIAAEGKEVLATESRQPLEPSEDHQADKTPDSAGLSGRLPRVRPPSRQGNAPSGPRRCRSKAR